jgi:hypothetical protein
MTRNLKEQECVGHFFAYDAHFMVFLEKCYGFEPIELPLVLTQPSIFLLNFVLLIGFIKLFFVQRFYDTLFPNKAGIE